MKKLSFILLLCLPFYLEAQTSPNPSLTSTQEVFNAYLKAVGGEANLKAVRDLTVNTTTEVRGSKVNNVNKYIPDDTAFSVTISVDNSIVQKLTFHGKTGTISGLSYDESITGKQAEEMKVQAYPFPELDSEKSGITTEFIGIEEVNGQAAYKIKMTSGNSYTYAFYDCKSGLKIKAIGYAAGGNQEVTFEDYRKIGNILYPYLSKSTVQGIPIQVNVTDVKINSGLEVSDL